MQKDVDLFDADDKLLHTDKITLRWEGVTDADFEKQALENARADRLPAVRAVVKPSR